MIRQIKNREGEVIFEDSARSLRELLTGARRERAPLFRADLSGAQIPGIDLSGMYMRGADFSKANLTDADMSMANVADSVFMSATLDGANMFGADASGAGFSRASMVGSNLSLGHFANANFVAANLTRANFFGAWLSGSDLPAAVAARLSIVPERGAFEGWKKCRNNVIVRLLILEKARRSSATSRRCRAERILTLSVEGGDEGISIYDENVTYKREKITECHLWDTDRWCENTGGIHFYLTRAEAEDHQ